MLKKIATFITALALFASPALADTTVVVSGDTAAGENMPGWLFNRDVSTSTPYEFNTNEASIGVGSLYVLPIGANPSDKFIAENFLNAPLSEVSSISYDFMIGSGGAVTDENQFYMSVYANFGESDDLKFYDCRYSVVPAVGSQAVFTTVNFDPTQSYPVATSGSSPYACPSAPADMDLSSPGSNLRMFALNVGDTAAGDVGLDGYLDNVVVDLVSGTTTYDFEPTFEACKAGGWMLSSSPLFSNQGDCVSYHQSSSNAKGNKSK